MSDVVISVENLSKKYRLGEIGVTTLREAAERSWLSLKRRFSLAERAENAERDEARRGQSRTESTELHRADKQCEPGVAGIPERSVSESRQRLPPLAPKAWGKPGQSGKEAGFTELASQQFREKKNNSQCHSVNSVRDNFYV